MRSFFAPLLQLTVRFAASRKIAIFTVVDDDDDDGDGGRDGDGDGGGDDEDAHPLGPEASRLVVPQSIKPHCKHRWITAFVVSVAENSFGNHAS